MQEHENAVCRKLIPILRPKTEFVKVAQHTLTLVILDHVTLCSLLVFGAGLKGELAYFLQRHPGVNLINIDCELILDALHLVIEVRGGH